MNFQRYDIWGRRLQQNGRHHEHIQSGISESGAAIAWYLLGDFNRDYVFCDLMDVHSRFCPTCGQNVILWMCGLPSFKESEILHLWFDSQRSYRNMPRQNCCLSSHKGSQEWRDKKSKKYKNLGYDKHNLNLTNSVANWITQAPKKGWVPHQSASNTGTIHNKLWGWSDWHRPNTISRLLSQWQEVYKTAN